MGSMSLVVLAAGLGARFGGNKQVAVVDDAGQTLVDYAVYDGLRAGFSKVVIVVNPDFQSQFHALVGARLSRQVDLAYAYQRLDDLPPGATVPAGRLKPWGTGQAVLAALPLVEDCFATVNADDFYGANAYCTLAAFLAKPEPQHALVGYRLANTLSSHGQVSRGICQVDDGGRLIDITERTALLPLDGGAIDEAGAFIDGDTPVSLNLWGFRPSARTAFGDGFTAFLARQDAASAEFYLPDVASTLIPDVSVLPTTAQWAGITYADDLRDLRQRLAGLIAQGLYPSNLWN